MINKKITGTKSWSIILNVKKKSTIHLIITPNDRLHYDPERPFSIPEKL
jgi:hypothetical protein